MPARCLLRGIGLRLVSFLTLFLLTCRALNFVRPLSGTDAVEEKFNFFERHREEFDTLFIGSSRVNMQIDPARFDAVLAGHRMQSKSYNFGFDGMSSPEDQFVCDRILALHPRRLRTVFVEIGKYLPLSFPEGSMRSVYYHDAQRTFLKCRMILEDERAKAGEAEAKTKRRFSWRKVRQDLRLFCAGSDRLSEECGFFAQHVANYGRGAMLMNEIMESGVQTAAPNPVDLPTGFAPLPSGIGRAKHIDVFRTELNGILRKPPKRIYLSEMEESNLMHIVKATRAAGAQPVFLICPFPWAITYIPRDTSAPLFDYSDPRSWPDLYKEDERRDLLHLNPKGAERYSQTLAECWVVLHEKMNAAGRK